MYWGHPDFFTNLHLLTLVGQSEVVSIVKLGSWSKISDFPNLFHNVYLHVYSFHLNNTVISHTYGIVTIEDNCQIIFNCENGYFIDLSRNPRPLKFIVKNQSHIDFQYTLLFSSLHTYSVILNTNLSIFLYTSSSFMIAADAISGSGQIQVMDFGGSGYISVNFTNISISRCIYAEGVLFEDGRDVLEATNVQDAIIELDTNKVSTSDSRLSDSRTPTDSSTSITKLANELKSIITPSSSNIDWSLGIQFNLTLTATTSLTFSNLKAGKTITLVVTGNFTLIMPSTGVTCKRLGGLYFGNVVNMIQIYCSDETANAAIVWFNTVQSI